jgi:hypothetical protein
MLNKIFAYLVYVIAFWTLAVAPAVLFDAADGAFMSVSLLCAILPVSPLVSVFWGRLLYVIPVGFLVVFTAMSMNDYVLSSFVSTEVVTGAIMSGLGYVVYLIVLYSILAYVVKRVFNVDLIRYPKVS